MQERGLWEASARAHLLCGHWDRVVELMLRRRQDLSSLLLVVGMVESEAYQSWLSADLSEGDGEIEKEKGQKEKEKEKVTVYSPAMVQKWWEEIAHLAWKQQAWRAGRVACQKVATLQALQPWFAHWEDTVRVAKPTSDIEKLIRQQQWEIESTHGDLLALQGHDNPTPL